MRWRWFGSPHPEDRFETWFNQQREELVLQGKIAPPVGPCPDEAFLRALAERSRRIVLSDPRIDHALECPTCMRMLQVIRGQRDKRLRRLALTTAAACCLLVIAAVVFIARRGWHVGQPLANLAASSETLDLSNAGAYRGNQPAQLQSVSLPTALVKVTIVLPRYSTPGKYVVAVTRDQSGNDPVAVGGAPAVGDGSRETVTVTLDLRSAKAGPHFLSTTRERDEASYYYPLDIRQ
jgi:hypothetical protein